MAQIFSRRANPWAFVLVSGSLAVMVAVVVLWLTVSASSYATGVGATPEQPVPFSHKHHVGGLGIDCGYCHTTAERSPFAGLPDTGTCMTCHRALWTDAAMLAPVRDSQARRQPLRWTRVHDLADYVYFDHRAHVNNGVGCESCHGRVDRMPLMRQQAPLTMQWCLDCHRNPAPLLRPRAAVTRMGYQPGPDAPSGSELLERYHIHSDVLTECSICHR